MSVRRPVLLILDDEESVRSVVGRCAARASFEVAGCVDHEAALRLVAQHRADVVMAGLPVPGVDATDLLQAIRRLDVSCQVVVISPDRSPAAAVAAIRAGALGYLAKPIDEGRLDQLFSGIRQEIARRQHLLASEGEVARRLEFLGMVGRTPAMQELFSQIRRMAPYVRAALVTGETGCGKELVARALHALGPWRTGRFTALSCAALSTSRPERSNHERWAIAGSLEATPSGTLLLDEVSELPMGAQEALLAFLNAAGVPGSVAADDGRGLDLQVIAATGRDLRAQVAAGCFRRDLYVRLASVDLHVPPLRERRGDIPYLAAHFLREFAREFQRPLRGLTVGAERYLVSAPWPGNVRELRNVLERACLLAEGDLLTEREVGDGRVAVAEVPPADPVVPAPDREVARHRSPVTPLATVERDCVLGALQQARGNKKMAAKLLGLSRRAFYRRLERHQLDEVIHRRTGRDGMAVA